MSSAFAPGHGFLALRDRAWALVAACGRVDEDALLAHVYGGAPPVALRAQFAAPLLGDPRLVKHADGSWALAAKEQRSDTPSSVDVAFTTLALAASGPNPNRGRVVRLAAHHVLSGETVERFSATVNPGARVPRYVAERLRLATDLLDDLPAFDSILDELVRFLGTRPVLAQDAHLTWGFVLAEARRSGVALAEPVLMDLNQLAIRLLGLDGKPTLAVVAARLAIGTVRVTDPDEEARVLGHVGTRLLTLARAQGVPVPDASRLPGRVALQRQGTARSLPDEPGVYVMRDTDSTALYIGKARKLRSRVSAYANRPLGPTRRLEGLVGAVQAVESTRCDTDLEALVLEDREIRRLQPRFNTTRQQRLPRVWIRLPPVPEIRPGKRQLSPRRLEPSLGPSSGDGEFVGPFRNESAAEASRRLAREVFELDGLRQADVSQYEARLGQAWAFLHGESAAAEAYARQRSSRLLRAVLAFDPMGLLLPADPHEARYAVVRPGQHGIEGFLLDRGVFRRWTVLQDDDATGFAAALLTGESDARTAPEDVVVVLRWLSAQHPPARLVYLTDDQLAAAEAIEDAVLEARPRPGVLSLGPSF